MGKLVKAGKKDFVIRDLAMKLVSHLPPKNKAAETEAIFNFVRDKIRFIRDVRGVETLQTADKTLEFGQGDCDDKSVLLAALLESIGLPTRLEAVGFRRGVFSHVWTQARLNGNWVTLDATESHQMGWEPQHVVSRLIYFN